MISISCPVWLVTACTSESKLLALGSGRNDQQAQSRVHAEIVPCRMRHQGLSWIATLFCAILKCTSIIASIPPSPLLSQFIRNRSSCEVAHVLEERIGVGTPIGHEPELIGTLFFAPSRLCVSLVFCFPIQRKGERDAKGVVAHPTDHYKFTDSDGFCGFRKMLKEVGFQSLRLCVSASWRFF